MNTELQYTYYPLPNGDEIDLSLGFPEPDSIPIKSIRECFAQLFVEKSDQPEFFQYGHFAGYGKIRALVADFLTRFYGLPSKLAIDKGNVIICGGVSFGLDSILTVLRIDSTKIVYCEEMTYFCALDLLGERGCEARFIPFTPEGVLDLDWLDEKLKSNPEEAERTALVYTIPTFQNPCGALMPEETRKRLVSLAHKYDFYIASDEVYHTLAFSEMRRNMPSSLALLDDKKTGRVMSMGSLSKVMSPALRFGWIHTSSELYDRLENAGVLVSGSCVCHLTCGAMEAIFQNGKLESLIQTAADSLERKAQILYDALKLNLPEGCSLNSFNRDAPSYAAKGGYFMLIQLPPNLVSTDVAKYCKETCNLTVKASSTCGDSRTNRLRLCFAYHKEEELVESAERLGKAIKELMESN